VSDREPPSCAARTAASSDRNGNGKRFPNYQRDAHFFPAFRAVREAAVMAAFRTSSVTMPLPSSISLPWYDGSPISQPKNVESQPSLIPLAFEKFIASKTTARESQMIASRTPAVWRDLTPWMQMLYRHFAAGQLGTLYNLTLNLDVRIEALARVQTSAAAWLQKRMARELRKALPGEQPTFFFVVEQVNGYRHMHLHGEIVTGNVEAARKALRLAAGEWTRARQHQAHTKLDPNAGWVSYAAKDNIYNGRNNLPIQRNFCGDAEASTHNLTRAAQDLYDADRQKVLQDLRAGVC